MVDDLKIVEQLRDAVMPAIVADLPDRAGRHAGRHWSRDSDASEDAEVSKRARGQWNVYCDSEWDSEWDRYGWLLWVVARGGCYGCNAYGKRDNRRRG